MQFRIYQRLNQLLVAMALSDIVIIVYAVLNLNALQGKILTYFIIALIYNIACFLIFKMLENNWDKRLMQKMAMKGHMVLAHINKTEKFMSIKESSGVHYNLWRFDVTYWDHEMVKREGVLVEKLNPLVESVPQGHVYITNDEKKPLKRFIMQNFVIGNLPNLIPIVAKYENNKTLKIKYLNVYYNGGLIIETYKESLKEASKQKAAN